MNRPILHLVDATSLLGRIIEAGLEQFGTLGFDGASTREIARASGTAMSSITYHFGGKQGLYLACADHIANAIAAVHAPLIEEFQARPPAGFEQAREAMLALLHNFARFMLAEESAAYCQFIVREQQHPTEAFVRIHDRVMQPVFEASMTLLETLKPSLNDLDRRALMTNLIGMVLILRLARAFVAKVMKVDDLDPKTTDRLIANLMRSAETLLSAGLR